MQNNHFAGKVRTRFVCGLGPNSSDIETMEKLIKAGANVFRNNFAHAQHDEYKQRLANLRELNAKLGTNVLMMADLKGQNIRLGMLEGESVQVEAGKEYVFVTNGGDIDLSKGELPINDDNLHNDVKAGEPITFADGDFEGVITNVDGHRITVKLNNGGTLKQRKSINVPDTDLTASNLTEKDYVDLDFLLETGVDILGVSFIAGREELDIVRDIATKKGKKPCIVSKIERKKAIDNLWPIIEASDAIMIARGDLGIELPMEEIPVLQKEIIRLAHHKGKPVITATQMMLSMVSNIRPTRAEVSDVANAVYDKSDALMLSEETMVGEHPERVVETMVRIATHIEGHIYGHPDAWDSYGM